ncbi:MAG: sigma-70 family RNA polymerase sigma factor [Bacteroidota bacterium]|nr:sigma-70 family RNA polymerase sigma factor [Bacteroidota bacterium]
MNKEQSEDHIVEGSRAGDRSAFNQLVRLHQERIYWVIRRMIRDHDDALDLTQEVFIRAYEKLDRFRGDAKVFTWLYRIAVNLSLNHIRKSRVRSFFSLSDREETIADESADADEDLERLEMRKLIARAVETLPEKQRAVFVLRYFEELPYENISTILETSVGGLKANYHHAVRKIDRYVKAHM